MNYSTLISKRQSVRKYSETELGAKMIAKIEEALPGLTPLRPDIRAKLEILPQERMHRYFSRTSGVKAPHYLVITSETVPLSGENAGFLGQQAVLLLTSLGVGTCWLGGFKEREGAFPLPFVIAIAMGLPQGELLRGENDKVHRKALSDICLAEPATPFATAACEAVRMAPSAVNGQPWRLMPQGDSIHLFCETPSVVQTVNFHGIRFPMPGSMLKANQAIDCGIALAHIAAAAEAQGMKIEFIDQGVMSPEEKLHYVLSAVVKK